MIHHHGLPLHRLYTYPPCPVLISIASANFAHITPIVHKWRFGCVITWDIRYRTSSNVVEATYRVPHGTRTATAVEVLAETNQMIEEHTLVLRMMRYRPPPSTVRISDPWRSLHMSNTTNLHSVEHPHRRYHESRSSSKVRWCGYVLKWLPRPFGAANLHVMATSLSI